MATLRGSDLPERHYVTTGRVMTLVFKSDYSLQRDGFEASFIGMSQLRTRNILSLILTFAFLSQKAKPTYTKTKTAQVRLFSMFFFTNFHGMIKKRFFKAQ